MEIVKITLEIFSGNIQHQNESIKCFNAFIYYGMRLFVLRLSGNNHFTLSWSQMVHTGCLLVGMHPEAWLRSVWRKMP